MNKGGKKKKKRVGEKTRDGGVPAGHNLAERGNGPRLKDAM